MDAIEATRILFEEGLNQQEYRNVRRVLADEVPYHLEGETNRLTISSLEADMAAWHSAFSGFGFEIHSITSQENLVAVRATLHGTQTEPMGEFKGTGRSLDVEHAFFLRVEDGVMWEVVDRSTFHKQLAEIDVQSA